MICIYASSWWQSSWHLTDFCRPIITQNHLVCLQAAQKIIVKYIQSVLPDDDMHPPHNNVSIGEKDSCHEPMSDCKDQAEPFLRHILEIWLIWLGPCDMAGCHIQLLYWVRHGVTNICGSFICETEGTTQKPSDPWREDINIDPTPWYEGLLVLHM